MQPTYSISTRRPLPAAISLVLCLQSCLQQSMSLPNPNIKQQYQKQQSSSTQVLSSCPGEAIIENIVPEQDELANQLSDKSFIAAGGYLVRFAREYDAWLALVQPSDTIASPTYQLPLHIAPGMHLAALLTLNTFWQRLRIHVILQEKNEKRIPAYVYVGSMGLLGGGSSSSKDSCPYAGEEAIWVSEKNAWMCRGRVHYRDKPEHIRLAEEEAQRKKEEQRRREEQRICEEQLRKEEQQRREEKQRKREEEQQNIEAAIQKREEAERKKVEEEQQRIKEIYAQEETHLEQMAAQNKLRMEQMKREHEEANRRLMEEFRREEELKKEEERHNEKFAELQQEENNIAIYLQESRIQLEMLDQEINRTMQTDIAAMFAEWKTAELHKKEEEKFIKS